MPWLDLARVRNGLVFTFAISSTSGFGLGAAGCADPDDPSCTTGSLGCACYPGNVCLAGLTCLSGICLQFGSDEETTGDPGDGDPGDGDGDAGDGDGDTGPGDGDGDTGPGDGDGDAGDGDGDTGPGDGDGDGDGDDPCAGAPVLLYSQGARDAVNSGVLAGTFTDINGSSVELADDFVVPQIDSCWCITEIVARGFYNDGILPGNTPGFFVEIYDDGNAVPTGAPIASEQGVVSSDDDGFYTATMSMDMVVPAGTHWLSFRPVLAAQEAIWYWGLATTQSGDLAAMRDEDSISLMGLCNVWTPAATCFPGDPPPDPYIFELQFDIFGIIGGNACN
jgi:hypothetical protein